MLSPIKCHVLFEWPLTKNIRNPYLALKSGALPDEEVVEVALQRLLVNVKDFAAQVKTQGSVRPPVKVKQRKG
jgi:hypothetical protein